MNRFVRLLVVAAALAGFAVGCNKAKDVNPSTFAPPPKFGPAGVGADKSGGVPNKPAPQVSP